MAEERAKWIAVGALGASVVAVGGWLVGRNSAPDRPAEPSAAALVDRLDGLDRSVALLHGKLDALAPGERAPPPPVEPPPPPPPPAKPVKGQVLAVDNESGIFLVSLGRKDGLAAGHDLTVYRGDKFVAVVVVDKVFEDKASVVIKSEEGKPLIKEDWEIRQGDRVATFR